MLVHSEYSINIERSKEGRGNFANDLAKTCKKLGCLQFKHGIKVLVVRKSRCLRPIRTKNDILHTWGGGNTNTHESGDAHDDDGDNDNNSYLRLIFNWRSKKMRRELTFDLIIIISLTIIYMNNFYLSQITLQYDNDNKHFNKVKLCLL